MKNQIFLRHRQLREWMQSSVGASLTILIAFAVALPILWLALSAFRPQADIIADPYGLPHRLTLENFRALSNIPEFTKSTFNSLVVAILTTCATVTIAFPIGYLLARYRFVGRGSVRLLTLVGYLFAPAVLALPYFQWLAWLGLVDTLPGITIAHMAFCLPFTLALSEIVVSSVPTSIEEIALLNGMPLIKRIFIVVVPVARYQVAALLLLVFIISWKEFFFAFLISAGDKTRTLPVLLASFYGGESLNWHLLFALSAILALPSTLLLMAGRLTRIAPLLSAGSRG